MAAVNSRGALRHLEHNSDWGAVVKEVLRDGIQRPKKGKDVGDHPPITPMKSAEKHQFDHDSWRLYEYIVKHFVGTVSTLILMLLLYACWSSYDIYYTRSRA